MQQYLALVERVIRTGEKTATRTGVETYTVFGAVCEYDFKDGFPILTTKKVLWNTVVDELLWFIRGGHNVYDADAPKHIWDAWASEDGDLGRIYGVQWRSWGRQYDQLSEAIRRVKYVPDSRRNLVSAWNVTDIENGMCSFPPCHVLFQFRRFGDFLDMAMYQRSADLALGVPFNISSYALLLAMVAHECNVVPRKLVHFMGDCHVYVNHIEKLQDQIERMPYRRPTLCFDCPRGMKVVDMTKDMLSLVDYKHWPFIKFQVAV